MLWNAFGTPAYDSVTSSELKPGRSIVCMGSRLKAAVVAFGTEFNQAFAAAGLEIVSVEPDLVQGKDEVPTVAPVLSLACTVTMPLRGRDAVEATEMVSWDTSMEPALFSKVPPISPVTLHFPPVSQEPETFHVVAQAESRRVVAAIAPAKNRLRTFMFTLLVLYLS